MSRRAGSVSDRSLGSRAKTPGAAPPGSPKVVVTDAAVRDDALAILLSAAQAWAARGLGAVPVEAVWEQLWSVLEDGGLLKKRKAK